MELSHVRDGTGPPLLLVHGIGHSLACWRRVVPLLAEDYAVFAIDLPGFGASPPLDGTPTLAALTGACRAFMAAHGHERFHVAGNSLGGGIALELARTGRARSATGLSPIGFAHGRERVYGATLLKTTRAIAGALGPALDPLQRTGLGRTLTMGHVMGRPWRVPAEDAIRATHDLVAAPAFDAALPHVMAFDWTHGDLDVPVTIGWGTRDMLLIPRQGRRARRRMPRARHAWLRGCGHVPAWDDPAQVAGVVLAGSRDA
jgi:pimeloyl-ACP methyl ester carboxylesterase